MIRPATAADRDAVVALWEACELTRPYNNAVADFDRAIEGGQSGVFVVERHGAIVGSMLLGDDSHRGWVYYLSVAPALHRSGVGRDLMAFAEEWFASRGCPAIRLMVRTTNLDVIAFYDSLGYTDAEAVVLGKYLGPATTQS